MDKMTTNNGTKRDGTDFTEVQEESIHKKYSLYCHGINGRR